MQRCNDFLACLQDLSPNQGPNPHSCSGSAVLTTGQPGKSCNDFFFFNVLSIRDTEQTQLFVTSIFFLKICHRTCRKFKRDWNSFLLPTYGCKHLATLGPLPPVALRTNILFTQPQSWTPKSTVWRFYLQRVGAFKRQKQTTATIKPQGSKRIKDKKQISYINAYIRNLEKRYR